MGTTQPIRKEDELYSFRMYYADEKPNVRNYTLIVLGLNTALRIGDLLSLKWSSVYNFQFQSFYRPYFDPRTKNWKTKQCSFKCHCKGCTTGIFQ